MTKQATSMVPEMETIEDMNQALRHLGWESADDLHSFAVHNDIERFEQLTKAFTRHRLASTAAIATERDALSELVGAAYQIVGALAQHGAAFDHPSVIRALDALSDQRETEPLLPWPHEPLPDMSERDALAARVEALEGVARDAVLAMPVLATMLKKARLGNGANVANRMHDAARKALGDG